MHDDETTNGGGRFGGAYLDATGERAESNNKFGHVMADIDMDNIEDLFFAPRSFGGAGAAMSAANDAPVTKEDGLAHNVNDFLDDFLLSARGGGMGVGAAGGADGGVEEMEVTDEDLSWLEDPGFLLPATSASCASAPAVMTAPDDGDALLDRISAQSAGTAVPGWSVGRGVSFNGDVSSAMGMSGDGYNERARGADAAAAQVESAAGSRSSMDPTAAVGISAPPTTTSPVPAPTPTAALSSSNSESGADLREKLRRQKVARYLEKKKRRVWSKTAPYKSRQRVANARPRHKGRFLPLESDFVPIAELQRRQRALFRQMQEACQQDPSARASAGDA